MDFSRDRPESSTSDASLHCEDPDGEHAHLLSDSNTTSALISDEYGGLQPLLRQDPLTKPTRTRRLLQLTRTFLLFLLANWYKFVLLGLIITLIVLVSIHGFSFFGTLLKWFKRHNGWGGWGIFIGVYTVVVALFFPGVVFILGAGFVFGIWRGLLAVWIGGAVGQALAFLLARYLLRDWVENFVRSKWEKWKYIDAAIEHEGWKLVLILRLSPIIPYNLLNIAMATTSMHFWQFTLVSSIGILFECSVFTYLGTMADSISSIVSGEAGPPKVIQWIFLGVSLFMCIVGTVFVSIMVRRAIRKAEEASTQELSSSEANALDREYSSNSGLGEQETLLATPSTLEREGYIRSIPGFSKLAEAKNAIFNLQTSTISGILPIPSLTTPDRNQTLPGTLTQHLRTATKAKTSPRALEFRSPYKATESPVVMDVEMGSGMTNGQQHSSLPMSASRRPNRRTSSRQDLSDEE